MTNPLQPDPQTEIIWRLNIAAGHLRAIRELIEAGKPCEELIYQLEAVKAAVQVAGDRLLACQIKQSEEIIVNGSVEARRAEMARLHKLYVLSARRPVYESESNK